MAYTSGLIAHELNTAFSPYGQKVSDGTTIIAAEFNGGVILGADMRTSQGSLVLHRTSNKITEVTSHICCLRSGATCDTQAVTDVVQHHLSVYEMEHGCPPPVHVGAQVFRGMCYRYRDNITAGIIVAGWDKKLGGQVYTVPLGGTVVRSPIGNGGSGTTYIYAYLDKNYRPGMSRQECEDFVKKGVALAMSRDGGSGGGIRIGTITEAGIEKQLFTGGQIPQIVAE